MENQEEVIQQLKKLKQISNAPEKEIDLEKAALLLLQFNRNKILYDNITKRKLYAKLKYEARKTFDLFCARLGINSDSFEEDPGAVMEEQEKRFQAIPPVEELEKTRGIRADHNALPENIRLLFTQNSELYLRMRKLHEALKTMDGAKPCDRFPYFKEFLELDDTVVKNWEMYDAYKLETEINTDGDKNVTVNKMMAETTQNIDAKRISANRKYISDNKEKLAKLSAENSPKAEALRVKMQERVTELLTANAGMSDEQLTDLAKLGINV